MKPQSHPVAATLPYQPHSDTSRDAAETKRSDALTELRRVEHTIRESARAGLSDRQIAAKLDMLGNTVRPRRRELYKAGRVCARLDERGMFVIEHTLGRTGAQRWVHMDYATIEERARWGEDVFVSHPMTAGERERCAQWVLDNDLWAPGRDNPPPATLQQAVTVLFDRRAKEVQ